MTSEERKKQADERARRNRIPLPTDDYDWHDVARKRGVPEDDIRRLADQKLLVGRTQFEQSFEVYTAPTVPVFITSDAVLNGFHALFEDSFRELEIRRAPELRTYLEQVVTRARAELQHAPFPMSDLGPGWQQAQRVVGPALVLLGTPLDFFDAEVRNDITEQVRLIRAADAVELPRWLAPATPTVVAIDYRRMKPVGFYSGLTFLADYFRAVRWLQSVPFRPERDVEFTAIALLGMGVKHEVMARDDFLNRYVRFLGESDDPGLLDAERIMGMAENDRPTSLSAFLEKERADMLRRFPRVKDTLRTTNTPPDLPSYYVLPAFALPDAKMFQILVDHDEPVTGLYVAQMLGSTLPSGIQPHAPEFVVETVKRTSDRVLQKYVTDESPTYDDYLAVLHTLFAPADPDAPAFMASSAWSVKSTQTCLAGWAQMRHTFALQVKQVIVTLGMHDQPPGFIEPNPAFFRRFSEFLERTRAKFETEGTFTENGASIAALLRTRADGLDRLSARIKAHVASADIPEYNEVNSWIEHAGAFDALPDTPETGKLMQSAMRSAMLGSDTTAEPLDKLSTYLKQLAARYEHGSLEVPVKRESYTTLEPRWQTLERTVSRLETLLQKQLRGRDWNDEEARFIKEFGPTLAATMGYFGNDYIPRDDAPRCVEFLRDARIDVSLNAAIGRPRVFYVLYPWQGREIYCEGAVMPYYEFTPQDRLTDDQWRAKLDSTSAPSQPEWTKSISSAPIEPLGYPPNARINHE